MVNKLINKYSFEGLEKPLFGGEEEKRSKIKEKRHSLLSHLRSQSWRVTIEREKEDEKNTEKGDLQAFLLFSETFLWIHFLYSKFKIFCCAHGINFSFLDSSGKFAYVENPIFQPCPNNGALLYTYLCWL